jgi:hypothetical protein
MFGAAESVLSRIGDLGLKGLVFISAEDSPAEDRLLVAGGDNRYERLMILT